MNRIDLIKPVEKIEKGYRRDVLREKSPREYVIDYLLEQEDIDWLKEVLIASGVLKDRDRIERIIRDLEKTYKDNPRFKDLKTLQFKQKEETVG